LLQVHDELIFEVPSEEIDSLADILREIMPAALDLVVPLNIEVKSARNWRDLEPLQVG
ncbi:MAG: DNA polymerase I, partial [Chloroflexi bacterium]|nr:DNA polymerase I [Chloroflexota bacterium]